MKSRIRRQRRRTQRRRPNRARPMFQLVAYIRDTHRQELGQRLLRVGVGNTLDELMNGADGVRSDVAARIVVDHVQDHVVQRVGKVDTNLRACTSNSVNNLD